MPGDGQTAAEKATSLDVLSRSVVDVPQSLVAPTDTYILWVAQMADGIEPWGRAPKMRDRQLRGFYPTESFLLSALGVVCSRNAALSWTLEGPDRTVRVYQDILLNAQFGHGWEEFITKTSLDLYTQDSGAFVEFVRQGDSEGSPVIGINQLDAGRCWPTGSSDTPVIYIDRLGQYHGLKPYNICNLHEMPAPVEHPQFGALYTIQYCAVTRLLRAAQILRNISIYKDEKTGGRFNRAVHLLRGITPKQIKDALAEQASNADGQGLLRYVQPPMIGSVSPTAEIGHDTIELAMLPDGYDEEVTFKHYISAIAMAFLSDYQEFAPLPGGGLGTSAQSQILHLKSRGKGPALFQKLISHLMNFQGVLPKNVEFKFAEQDIEAEKEKAELEKLRAEARAVRVQSGEITPEVARQIAKDEGDLAPEVFDAMGGLDLTPHITLQDEEKPEVPGERPARQLQQQVPAQPPPKPGQPPATAEATKTRFGDLVSFEDALKDAGIYDIEVGKADADAIVEEIKEAALELKAALEERHLGPEEIEDDREQVETLIKTQALKALRKLQRRIMTRLREEA